MVPDVKCPGAAMINIATYNNLPRTTMYFMTDSSFAIGIIQYISIAESYRMEIPASFPSTNGAESLIISSCSIPSFEGANSKP